MSTAKHVLAFWEEAGPTAWYSRDDAFDQAIRDQFGDVWQTAYEGDLPPWAVDAQGALGLVILLDQFPRNMFRDDPRAFGTDAAALDVAGQMLARGWDLEITGLMRQFAYMPFMHSEDLRHQETCVDLMEGRMEDDGNVIHAHAHREIIAQFGRFPFRNGALGRDMTPSEQAFLDEGAYGAVVRALQAKG